MKKEDLIKLGFCAHPHGIKGEAEFRLINTEDSILDDGMKIYLYPSNEKSQLSHYGEEWKISKIRFGNKVIVTLEGIKDRTHLETILPFEIFLPREAFPAPDEGEVYLVDLIGMRVQDPEGKLLGKLDSFDDNGMQYLFNVRMDNGEMVTLPYVDAFFPEINMEEKFITMIPPEYAE
jgi:16S rRNA processing protein RimM